MLIVGYGFVVALANGWDAYARWKEHRAAQTEKWLEGWRR
jgi:hypothetical protein